MAQSSSSKRPQSGGHAQVAADAGDQFADREVGEIGLLIAVGQAFFQVEQQAFNVGFVCIGLDGLSDDGLDLAPAASGAGVGILGAPRSGLRLVVLREPGLQGDGLAHGAGDAGEGQAYVGGARVGRGLLMGLPLNGPREVHADLGELLEVAQMAFSARLGRAADAAIRPIPGGIGQR